MRIHTVSTSLTDAEKDDLEARVSASGLNQSEYVRERLLGRPDRLDLRVILAEQREHRSITLALVTAALNKQPITHEMVQQIVAEARAKKYERAGESLGDFAAQAGGGSNQ